MTDERRRLARRRIERVSVSLAKDQDVAERFSLAAGDKRFAAAANGQLFHIVGRKALQNLAAVAASHMKNSAAGELGDADALHEGAMLGEEITIHIHVLFV